MEIANLVLEYFKVLAWPIVVVIIIRMFRAELKGILIRIRKAELPMGVSLDFQEELQEAKVISKQVETESEKERKPNIPLTEANARLIELGLQPSPSGLDMNYYRTLASQDPNIALAGLRIEIDILARNLAKGFKLDISRNETGAKLLRRLRDAGAITSDQLQLTLKVLQLCNAVVHGDLIATQEQANDVIDLANVLRDQYLRWLSWGFDDGWRSNETRKSESAKEKERT